MPAKRKCCVVGCKSNSETHRLFNFPMNDRTRELWLHFLVPHCPGLSGLSKSQLTNHRVCQNHFDRYQFDGTGNRISHGYPCLFNEREILHRVPLHSQVENYVGDHNYAKRELVPEASTSNTSVEKQQVLPSASQSVFMGKIETNPELAIIKGKSREFMKNVKKIATKQNKNTKPFPERFKAAKNFNQTKLFETKFAQMSKQSQDFFLMQLKLSTKNRKALRFTMDEKLLALSLMKESPKGYRLLEKMFKLPTKRTLNRVAEKIQFNVGLNENLFDLLAHKVQGWEIKKKLCAILFDEISLSSHLTYVESQDEIRGFKDYGNEREFKFCDHALVLMLKGVCSNWRQPISYYFCEGTTAAATVVRILKEVVEKVTASGLIPVAIVCDQGSTFRTAIKILREDTEKKRNLNGERSDGTIEISGQNMSIFFDPPHLLKSIRNNLLTKDMEFKGKVASWTDIQTVYIADCQLGHTRMNKKLTDQHIIQEKIKKMKVSTAAQVLSETTSAMLKYTALFKTTMSGENVSDTMSTTGDAVEFFDRLFDSVNGSRRDAVKGKLRGPIKNNSKHFEFWQEAKKILKNIKYLDSKSKKAQKNKIVYRVSVPCLKGWITTIESFERLTKMLFEKYQLTYFYPRHINQDPLENFFGRIRAINYRNVNPDANTFINAFKTLLMSNVMGVHSIYANCEEEEGQNVIDFMKLLICNNKKENKENVPPMTSKLQCSDNIPENAINERLRVHSSAYTAGYVCRKLANHIKCVNCHKSYTTMQIENFHTWVEKKEYALTKKKNLCYTSKKFLLIYREISNFIHNYLNSYGFQHNVSKNIKLSLIKNIDLRWLGCSLHKIECRDFVLKLLVRVQIHNWCNIINKIMKGNIQERLVKKMGAPQQMAFDKYKLYRLRRVKN